MVSLCRLLHIDRKLTVTGPLPCGGSGGVGKLKSFAGDPKFVVKILLDSIDKRDGGITGDLKDKQLTNT